MATLHDPLQNRLLRALPEATLRRLSPALEPVSMPLSTVVYEPKAPLRHAFFPTTAIVSLLQVTDAGDSTEIAMAGNEGIVGFALVLGARTVTHSAVAQTDGDGFRLAAPVLLEEFRRGGALSQMTLRYTMAVTAQMGQTAVCNRHHAVDQQLCRWLLMCLDRVATGQLSITQELIANRLGVRREGVTEAASKLQGAGLIQYSRGHLRILDRSGLEARACECYGVLKREYDDLLKAYLATDTLPANG